jgi:1,4-dihydroxy-2-naphthoate octaprenyltransferase
MSARASGYEPFTLKAALELTSPPSLVAAVMPVLVGGAAALGLSPLAAANAALADAAAASASTVGAAGAGAAAADAGVAGWLVSLVSHPPLVLDLRAQIAWLLMLVTAVLMQAAVNTLNDYHDFHAGTDTAETILDEHDASIVYNRIDPRSALRFAFVLLGCAAASGVAVVALSGWPLLVVGLVAALVLVLYSFGPKPISYLPLGELLSGIVMGGAITGATYYVLTLGFTPLVLVFAVPPILTIALIMQTNNTCDIERDTEAGRRTLPIVLGRERSIALARVLAWATPAWMVLMLALAAVLLWHSLLLLFVNAIVAGCLYFLLHHQLERIAKGPYDLVNRGPMMGNITAFCRFANLAWAGAILLSWLLVQLMLKGIIHAI